MSLGIGRSAMCLAERVEVWACAGAAIRVIAELVDMEATLGGGVVPGYVPRYGGRGVFGGLLEGDGARDFRVASEDGD